MSCLLLYKSYYMYFVGSKRKRYPNYEPTLFLNDCRTAVHIQYATFNEDELQFSEATQWWLEVSRSHNVGDRTIDRHRNTVAYGRLQATFYSLGKTGSTA